MADPNNTLSWNDFGADSYDVEVIATNRAVVAEVNVVVPSINMGTLMAGLADANYAIRVRAHTGAEVSPWTKPMSFSWTQLRVVSGVTIT